MPKTVRIYGTARNIARTPPLSEKGVEVWLTNSKQTWGRRYPPALEQWTRWFNLHSKHHILATYPSTYTFYQKEAEGRPIYLQRVQPDIPTSVAFPYEEIQRHFATEKGPNRYFTCSACWLIALAILEGFERIELWGFALSDAKRKFGPCYTFERPAFFYWIQQARNRGIEVTYQKEIERLPFEPGDPDSYNGLVYGYQTKPETPPVQVL